MIVMLDVPGRRLRVEALKIFRRPIEQRAKFLTLLDNQVVWEALQRGLPRPEAYAHADSFMKAIRERIEFLDAALGQPGASIHILRSRNIYRNRKKETA